jgi:branched-chain amino acid transport system ATP-binding protein
LTDSSPLLVVQEVLKRFGGLTAVDGASLDVREGSITSLIGPNGAGKTTLFNVISRFYRPERGRVWFRGERIDTLPPHAIARNGLVRTFQFTKILTRMTVLENAMVGAKGQPGEHLTQVFFAPGKVRQREGEVRDRAMSLLELVGLARMARHYAGELSGGQRKLLELARVLMTEPRMVMLDEPMAGVNPTLGVQLLEYMRKLRDEAGITFLFIEHDMEVVMTVSERVIVMNEGKVIADGSPSVVQMDPRVIDAYLGTHRGVVTAMTGEP